MKPVLALTVTCAFLILGPATSAQAAPARTNRISVAYVPPKNPEHQPIYERLKEHRALERMQEFLSPFRLPRTVTVKVEGCDGDPNASYGDDAITVCYEYLDDFWQNATKREMPAGIAPIDAVVGPFFDVFLHEMGHALFDMLNLPVLGREEDAADQVSAYIMLHLGKAEARRLILGAAHQYKSEAKASAAKPAAKQFSDAHGTPGQRFYNLLCIAYGADAKLFGDLVEKGYLPKERAEGCDDEYQQVAYAFEKLIRPHIDRRLAKKVLDKSWLPDPKAPVPRRSGPKPSAQSQ